MSASAAWSYTSTATHWARQSRDDRTGVSAFAAPVTFACDYSSEARTMVDQLGREFTSRLTLHTERSSIARGDFVAIGASSAADPNTVEGAQEVLVVGRFADTFDGKADDYRVVT